MYTFEIYSLKNYLDYLRSTTDQHRLRFEMGNVSILSKRAFLYSSPEIWNSLPITIRSTSNHQTFKTALTK